MHSNHLLLSVILGLPASTFALPQPNVELGESPWEGLDLENPPAVVESRDEGAFRHLFFEALPFNGESSLVHAVYSNPTLLGITAVGESPFPGILLLHGGGGRAFPEWVREWAERGYAAMAIDLGGPDDPSTRPGASMMRLLAEWDLPREQRWFYHAPAEAILAHSLLRSFPEVDPHRTAVMGISWGGFVTCLAASLDHRFKAAVSVYGTGGLDFGSRWSQGFQTLSPERLEEWRNDWDPLAYLPQSTVPFLFVNGDDDPFFFTDALSATVEATPNATVIILPGFRHGHGPAFALTEVPDYIDSQLSYTSKK